MEPQREVVDVEGEPVKVSNDSNTKNHWNVWGRAIHKHEFAYFSTICILFTVILACLVNLTLNKGPTEVWLSLLASSVGILVPNPQIKALQIKK